MIAIDSESVHIEWYMPTNTNGILSIYTIFYNAENGVERNLIVAFNGQNVSQFYIHHMTSRYLFYACDVGTILQHYWTESIPTDHSDHYCY